VVVAVEARRLSRRDVVVLGWIGEQYVISRDVVGVLLGRMSDDEAARAAGRVTDTVVDRTLRRWRDLRLVHCRRFLVGESASVWPTSVGLRVAGLGYRPSEPSFATLAHRHAVARVRAHVEGRQGDLRWVCERELRDGTRGRRAHLPDGVVETDRGRTAIEVELTPKTEERVRDILGHLFAEYDRVVYYATPRAGTVVARAGHYRLDQGTLLLRSYPLTEGPCVDPPHTDQLDTDQPVRVTPDTEQRDTAEPDTITPPPAALDPAGQEPDGTGPAGEGEKRTPGMLEQQALLRTEAQMTALAGVQDAWRAAGAALPFRGRRRRR
jgi:hypothetical protein